jgi:peptidoglycan/LPS O-acetylase OafA/YrhL
VAAVIAADPDIKQAEQADCSQNAIRGKVDRHHSTVLNLTRVQQLSTGGQRTQFIGALESVRGLAAISVAIFHCLSPVRINGELIYNKSIWMIDSAVTLLVRIASAIFNGTAAVSIFFVISGFVLALALRRNKGSIIPKSLGFVGRRLFRIYPALFVNILIMAAVLTALSLIPNFFPSWNRLPSSLHDVVNNLLLTRPAVNGATWTLIVEIEAIPFILLAYFIVTIFGLRGLGTLTAIAVSLALLTSDGPPNNLCEFLFMFYLGMFGAWIGSARPTRDYEARLTPIGCLLATICLLSARMIIGYSSKWAVLVEGLSGAYLVTSLAFGRRWWIHTILESGFLRFLGKISYSLYLYHPLALPVIGFGLVYRLLPNYDLLTIPTLVVLTLCGTIPMAWASFTVIEAPAIKLGNQMTKTLLRWHRASVAA